jgi:hypothetical protein
MPRPLGDQIRQTEVEDIAAAGSEFVGVGRYLLERGRPVENMVTVDLSDFRDIALPRGTNHHTVGGHLCSEESHKLK